MTKLWILLFNLNCLLSFCFFSFGLARRPTNLFLDNKFSQEFSNSRSLVGNESKIEATGIEDDPDSKSVLGQLAYMNSLLINNNFLGHWNQISGKTPLNFSRSEGLAYLNYALDSASDSDFGFDLYIFDGPFTDQNVLRISFKEYIPWLSTDNYHEEQSTLILNDTLAYISLRSYHGTSIFAEKSKINSQIMFVNKNNDQPFVATYDSIVDKNNIAVQLTVQNENFSLNFSTSTLLPESEANHIPTSIYLAFMTSSALIGCLACHFLIKNIEKTNSNARKISLGTLRLVNAFDFYLCLMNLGKMMDNSRVVGLVAIPFAVLSLHFEFKLIVVVITTQTRLSAMDTSKLNCSNCIWLIWSLAAVVISGVWEKAYYIYFAFAFSQLPQIIQNFFLQQRQRWNWWILGPLSIPKMAYLFYVLVYSENLFKTSPHPMLFIGVSLLFILQLGVLLLQTRRPRLCYKEENFYKFYDAADKEFIGQDICCICLEKLHINQSENKEVLLSSSSTIFEKQAMVGTPCNHQFHETCLKDWIKLKHECPYCRCNLPFMPGEDE